MLQFLVTDRKAERIGGDHVIMLPGSEGVFQQFDDCLCSLTVPGKEKRMGAGRPGMTKTWKKAYVQLAADSKTIEFFEGMV
mgnify:CR=1 FL=1